MIILENLIKSGEKRLEDLQVGDVLKRKTDGCFYELENITEYITSHNFYYSFYGFVIKFSRNLRNHFVTTEENLFEIY